MDGHSGLTLTAECVFIWDTLFLTMVAATLNKIAMKVSIALYSRIDPILAWTPLQQAFCPYYVFSITMFDMTEKSLMTG